ncbi:cytochrome p450 [Paramarasmius palmivorus]|uniref:Cytochrome p450 n=1 Tax=Paramarasmius palmivorus TaxID=297713 RepID=A0AAW0CHI6_9AGAR
MDDHIVILNSVQAANDLFEKRSRIYSGRPNEEVCETAGWGFNIVIQDHSEKWRQNRRVFQQTFRPDAVIEFRPAIQERVSFFLRCLCESPKDFMRHIDVLSGSISLKLMYGIDVETIDDPLISAGKLAVHTFDTIFAARFVAIMKYVPRQAIMRAPRWFPVLGPARRFIESSRKYVDDLVNLPMQQVQKMNTEAGGHIPRLLRKLDPNDSYELQKLQLMKDMASIAYLG